MYMPLSNPALGRVTRGNCMAFKLVFKLWDILNRRPIEEFPAHFGHEAAISDFAGWGEDIERSFMERSTVTSTANGPSIDETNYDDTTPYGT